MSYLRALLKTTAVATLFALPGCGSGNNGGNLNLPNVFSRKNLVSSVVGYTDSAGAAVSTDPNLKNPWGIAFNERGPFWISDNHSGHATLYNGAGAITPLVVNIPTATATAGGAVTGQVFNTSGGFVITGGAPSLFIFATEDGTISAWGIGSNAERKANRLSVGAMYKGLAIAPTAAGTFLYAADFHNGRIDVYNSNWALTTLTGGTFTDPNLPAGYAPFNVQNIGGSLFVTFAKQDAAKEDEVAGAGLGIVDIFSPDGRFVRRFATGSGAGGAVSELNAPWGIALAPPDFGVFSNALLVGNFGDGRITAFDPTSGAVLGQLRDAAGNPLNVPGLWAITIGNGGAAGQTNVLYFTAGIQDEQEGLFGLIEPKTRKGVKMAAK